MNDRLVLLPNERGYRLRMTVDIESVNRIDAIEAYVQKLARRYPSEYGNRIGIPAMNRPLDDPLYAEKVTVKGTATVLEQFVGLLGDNPQAVFSIMTWKGSLPIYVLDEVR